MTAKLMTRICALFLLAAGYGWAGGHFIPADAPLWAYLFQFVMLFLLVLFALYYLKAMAGLSGGLSSRRPWSMTALTVYSVLTLLINAANIIRGAGGGGPYGSHNTFADLVPIGLIMGGDILWLLTLLPKMAKVPG
jgi:hypothetical protein